MWFDNVKAVQVTEQNVEQVSKWIGGETVVMYGLNGQKTKQIIAQTPRGDVLICQGDWVGQDAGARAAGANRFRVIRIDSVNLDDMVDYDEGAALVKMTKKSPKPKPGPRR